MATLSAVDLSGAAAGNEIIPVASVSNPGTLIHTCHATAKDALYLWAANVTTDPARLNITISLAATPSDPADFFVKDLIVRPQCLLPIATGQRWSGSLQIRAFLTLGLTNSINISGHVTRWT